MIKFLSIELHETMALPGTDEASLTEVMISRSNQELAEIRNFFIDCKSQEHKKYILVNINASY